MEITSRLSTALADRYQIERTVTAERVDGDEVQTRTRNVVVDFPHW